MEEIFDSDFFTVEFDKVAECAILTWKKYEAVDSFRTPLMKAADMVRRHNGDVLIIDRTINPQVADKDKQWVGKIFLTALKQSGCHKIIVVAPESEYKLNEYPYDVASKKFDLERADSREAAIKILIPEAKMTVAEALAYMDLPADANDYAIDDRFWQMSKKIRAAGGDDYEAKLDELSEVYDIASGRKGARDKALAARNRKKQYFGKTGDEWRTYFSYTWYKYALILLGIILGGNLIYNIFFKPRVDCGVVSIGHFICTSEYYETLLMEEMGYKNAYVNTVDLVVPNAEGQQSGTYAEQSADTMLISEPNIIVTDTVTTPYYFHCFIDMSDTYEFLDSELPDWAMDKLVPVYYSEREYYYRLIEQERDSGINNSMYDTTLGAYDPTPIMVGIMVDDPEYLEAMGYECYWRDDDVRLVFSLFNENDDYQGSQQILLTILKQTL